VLYSALGVPAAGLAAIRELVEQAADVDDLAAPPVALLTREDLRANPSVELDQLLVDRECGTRARSTDLSLEASKQLGIAVRKGRSEKGLTADHCLHYRHWTRHFQSQLLSQGLYSRASEAGPRNRGFRPLENGDSCPLFQRLLCQPNGISWASFMSLDIHQVRPQAPSRRQRTGLALRGRSARVVSI
jgi:hypothetical protein